MSKYQIGHAAAMAKAMPAVMALIDRLADARRDGAEWKERHENLLAMFRASEERAAKAEALARSSCPPADRSVIVEECVQAILDYGNVPMGASRDQFAAAVRALKDAPRPECTTHKDAK